MFFYKHETKIEPIIICLKNNTIIHDTNEMLGLWTDPWITKSHPNEVNQLVLKC